MTTHLELFLDVLKALPDDLARDMALVRVLDDKVEALRPGFEAPVQDILQHATSSRKLSVEELTDLSKLLARRRRRETEMYNLCREKIDLASQTCSMIRSYITRLEDDLAKFEAEIDPDVRQAVLDEETKEIRSVLAASASAAPGMGSIPGAYAAGMGGMAMAMAAGAGYGYGGAHGAVTYSSKNEYDGGRGPQSTAAAYASHAGTAALMSAYNAAVTGTGASFGAAASSFGGAAAAGAPSAYGPAAAGAHGPSARKSAQKSSVSSSSSSSLGRASSRDLAEYGGYAGGAVVIGPSEDEAYESAAAAAAAAAAAGAAGAGGDLAAGGVTGAEGEVYCFCGNVGNSDMMIGCDNESCRLQWFHIACVGLKRVPTGSWFCAECSGRGTYK